MTAIILGFQTEVQIGVADRDVGPLVPTPREPARSANLQHSHVVSVACLPAPLKVDAPSPRLTPRLSNERGSRFSIFLALPSGLRRLFLLLWKEKFRPRKQGIPIAF